MRAFSLIPHPPFHLPPLPQSLLPLPFVALTPACLQEVPCLLLSELMLELLDQLIDLELAELVEAPQDGVWFLDRMQRERQPARRRRKWPPRSQGGAAGGGGW